MFTAMILGCALDTSNGQTLCLGFVSPYIFKDYENCVAALSLGAPEVEDKGWTIVGYECYDWTAREKDQTKI